MEIGLALRNARRAADMTQQELATQMRVSQGFIADLESGRRTFYDRYLEKLPDAVKPAVRAALVAEHEARIKHLMKE